MELSARANQLVQSTCDCTQSVGLFLCNFCINKWSDVHPDLETFQFDCGHTAVMVCLNRCIETHTVSSNLNVYSLGLLHPYTSHPPQHTNLLWKENNSNFHIIPKPQNINFAPYACDRFSQITSHIIRVSYMKLVTPYKTQKY